MFAGCRGDPPAPAIPTGPTVQLTVDDGAPRTIAIERTIPLRALLDVAPAAWIEVRAAATDERGLELSAPATRYPGSELRLYLDQGQPALGVFPPITPDMPADVAALARQPTASLTSLASVHVQTRPTARSGLVVVAEGREVAISGEQVHALPGVPRGTSRAQGWLLAGLIELASPGREVTTIRILGAGDPMTIGAQLLRDPAQIVVLKQNQRGEYVFRVWDRDGRYPTREVRRVTRIVLD
jgi:hypothetical protein